MDVNFRGSNNVQFSKITQISATSRFSSGVTIGALDLGSNSFHLVVVRAHSDQSFEVLLKEKSMLRLGDVVSRLGYIDEPHLEKVIDSINSYRALAESLGASELVALATSAFRDAENSSDVVDMIEEKTGVSVSVISGHKEAELIFKAVSSSVVFPSQVAMSADLGGGSLELIVGTQNQQLWSHSFNLGVGRLTARFLSNTDSIDPVELQRLRKHVRSTLIPLKERIMEYEPTTLVGSSGSFLCLAKMALMTVSQREETTVIDDLNQVSVKRSLLRQVGKLIVKSNSKDRLDIPGVDSKRVDILPAAAVVLEELLSIFKFKSMLLSEWALREGIILTELEGYDSLDETGDSIRLSSVLGVTKRFMWNGSHAQQVAMLALSIFDQTSDLHELSYSERELLHYGALLHDVGEYISMEDHDKHSAYLVENSRLRGFTPDEKRILVSLVRFHRRGTPKQDFASYSQLPDGLQQVVVKLVSILRLADALDRSHEAVVSGIDVSFDKECVKIVPKVSDDFELESFGMRRKRSLFEQVFDKKVVILSPLTSF